MSSISNLDSGSSFDVATPGDIALRPGRPEDAEICGAICYAAFKGISERHNFPPDFPTVEVAQGLMSFILSLDHVYSVVAEIDGQIVGSNFLWGPAPIAGVGPITISSKVQNMAIGRALMTNVIQHAREEGFAGVRLVQAGYHSRSLSLYSKLGFDVREPLVTLQGTPISVQMPGHHVRSAARDDVDDCAKLHRRIHGFERSADLIGAIERGTANVAIRDGKICGYTTEIGFFGHAIGVDTDALRALIAAAPEFTGPGFLVPSRNGELFRWCLTHGLRVVQPMTLMSMGLYSEPAGAFLPSILY